MRCQMSVVATVAEHQPSFAPATVMWWNKNNETN